MPAPPPPPAHRWKKGQTGNPNGYSQKRRVTDALYRMIARKKLAPEAALIIFAKAVGNEKVIKERNPDLGWMKLMLAVLGELEPIAAISNDNVDALREFLADCQPKTRSRKSKSSSEEDSTPNGS